MYPELSSTILPHSQEIRLFRGDDLDLAIQTQNDGDPPDRVPISDSVLRWAAKQGFGNSPTSLRNRVIIGNEGALLVKTSYDADEIEVTNDTQGQAILHLRREDTWDLPLGQAVWDLELVRPYAARVLPEASVQLSDGQDIAFAMGGLDWTQVRVRAGDIFQAQGRTVLVREVLSAAHLRLDFAGWTTAVIPTGAPPPCADFVCIYEARVKTVAFGAFVVMGDVVR